MSIMKPIKYVLLFQIYEKSNYTLLYQKVENVTRTSSLFDKTFSNYEQIWLSHLTRRTFVKKRANKWLFLKNVALKCFCYILCTTHCCFFYFLSFIRNSCVTLNKQTFKRWNTKEFHKYT